MLWSPLISPDAMKKPKRGQKDVSNNHLKFVNNRKKLTA